VSPDTSLRLGLRSGGGGGAARLRWDAEAAVKAGEEKLKRNLEKRYVRSLYFLPLAFETEGYHTDDLDKLLLDFALKRAAADGLKDNYAARKRARVWLDFLASCG
jgi:hypothetical protein